VSLPEVVESVTWFLITSSALREILLYFHPFDTIFCSIPDSLWPVPNLPWMILIFPQLIDELGFVFQSTLGYEVFRNLAHIRCAMMNTKLWAFSWIDWISSSAG
jgi:hypothetical protein